MPQCVRLDFRNSSTLPSFNAVIHCIGVAVEGVVLVIVNGVVHTHQRCVPDIVAVHHKRVPWVSRPDFKRSLGFRLFVRQGHAVSRAADHHPLDKLFVLGRFPCNTHHVVQSGDLFGHHIIADGRYVLNRFADCVTHTERDNGVRSVLTNIVADFRANLFCAFQDGLFAPVIVPEVLNLSPVDHVLWENIVEDGEDVLLRDRLHAGGDFPSPGQGPLGVNFRFT